MRSGLKKFQSKLHPEAVAEIRGWTKHPGLSKLLDKLEATSDWERFLDHYAEAQVARHLIDHGCEIEVEVPTINGKFADFRISERNGTVYIHVKRLNLDREIQHDLNVGKRLASLREEGLSFSFPRSLTDDEMQQFHKEASRLSKRLAYGESKDITGKNGEVLGECDKMEYGQSIALCGIKDGDCSERYLQKLKSSYKQFMPDALNVVLVTSAWRDDSSIEDLRESLDDFWLDGKHPCSDIVGWFQFDPRLESVDFELFFRKDFEEPPCIGEVFKGSWL